MPQISASVTNQQIQASVGETQIDVNVGGGEPHIDVTVSGGVGPTGPAGTTSWSGIVDRPSTFPPSAHTHTASQITDFSNAVVAAAPPTTNASLLTSGTLDAARLPGSVVLTTDARLSDARTPLSHTHTASQISDFTSAVIAAAPPTTNASLLTSGTLPDQRLSSSIARTSDVTAAVAAVVNAAPAALDTLKELADALGNDASFASTVTNSVAAKAPIASPTFTGTVSGVTKSMVGLGNVLNVDATARENHTGTQAISTVDGLQTAIDGKAAVSHAHSASQITDFTSAVVAAAPPTTDASLLTAGTLSSSRLPSTAVVAGSYGSASSVGTFTVDATGRLTSAGSASITAAGIGAAAASHTHTVSAITDAGTAATRNVPATGNAGTTEVVLGSDTRLSDQRTPTDGSVTAAKLAAGQSVSFASVSVAGPVTLTGIGGALTASSVISNGGVSCSSASVASGGVTVTGGSILVVPGALQAAVFSVSSAGVVTAGTWQGTAIAVARGGTGATTAADARANLGAAAASHTHAVSDISATGTPSSSTFLRGDGAWADPIAEYDTAASFPAVGNAQVLYIASDTGRQYQWTGSVYAEIGPDSAYVSSVDAGVLTGTVPRSTLPLATASLVGAVQAGSGVVVSGGVISVTTSSIGAANASHQHNATDINAGTLDTARLPVNTISALNLYLWSNFR